MSATVTPGAPAIPQATRGEKAARTMRHREMDAWQDGYARVLDACTPQRPFAGLRVAPLPPEGPTYLWRAYMDGFFEAHRSIAADQAREAAADEVAERARRRA